MHIHLLHAVNQSGLRASKDTNGGYGTVNDFGKGPAAYLLKLLKSRTMAFPELLPAYLNSILRERGYTVTYARNQLNEQADVTLIQTSITNYQLELDWADQIRARAPGMRIGFVGGMSAGNPERYRDRGDFVIAGEAENALMTADLNTLEGVVQGGMVADLDTLPFPDWSHIQNWRERYGFVRSRKGRFAPMLASRGCPMSCAYYCTYPLVQGKKFRTRSPENIVEEIEYLQKEYGITTILFRDPIFSLQMERIEQLCALIIQRGLKISWICETHPKFLTEKLVVHMAKAGCIAIKMGIESGNEEVMEKSHRAMDVLEHQNKIIRICEANRIDVLAFYILGYMDDSEETARQTIAYARKLNTFGAQFTIATPYPGTPWYDDLRQSPEEIRFDENLENYNQYRLVYSHKNLSPSQLERLKNDAYRSYYFRFSYLLKHLPGLI